VKSASPEPTIVEPEPPKDPYADVRLRHPLAQQSDLDAILKWETERKVEFTPITMSVAELRGKVHDLPNALVVRGGYDAVGWLRD